MRYHFGTALRAALLGPVVRFIAHPFSDSVAVATMQLILVGYPLSHPHLSTNDKAVLTRTMTVALM